MINKSGWIQTLTGKRFYPLDPTLESIDIQDIAGSLSKTCRFGGHCLQFYSVAEHCYHVSMHASPKNALVALLHDASEAYLGDIPRPTKPLLNGYKEIELNIMLKVAEKFGFDWPPDEEVKRLDSAILSDERKVNMKPTNDVWETALKPLGVAIKFYEPAMAELMFMLRFNQLTESATQFDLLSQL